MSWQGKRIFSTPEHNYMHDCIQEWTWKWDPEFMKSTVCPNLCQGIFLCSLVGQRANLLRQYRASGRMCKSYHWRLKVLVPSFPFSPYFGSHVLTVIYCLAAWTLYGREIPNTSYAWSHPSYGLMLPQSCLQLKIEL